MSPPVNNSRSGAVDRRIVLGLGFAALAAGCQTQPSAAIATPTLQGEVIVARHGGVTLHTCVSPADGVLVNAHILETPRRLVIFDAQFFTAYADEVARYAASLNKPVERIVLSHIHPDHWSGLGVLHAAFPDAPIYAHPTVTAYVRANAQTILASRRGAFGDRIAATPTYPTHDLNDGDLVIDGVRLIVRSTPDAESAYQTYVLLPDQHTLLAFDTVFPAQTHLFTVAPYFDHWIEVLRSYQALEQEGYRTILVGHGRPTDFSVLPDNIRYLETARRLHAESSTPQDYATRLKAAYPDYARPDWVDFSGLLLYGVINP